MKKILLLIITAVFCAGASLHAQERTVSGQVTDAGDGMPIPGVNVVETGTSNGTITDIDGRFTLSVGANATLAFSYIGYVKQDVAVGTRTSINVSLAPDLTQLSEVVVVGYGTQERKEITSAVASISEENFNRGNVTDPGQLIQGKVAGLSIVRPGGDPNAGFSIRLRGLSTFGANTQPLIVLDGVVGASLDNVDPNDIETIDILKDASAAAIYGTRGSSGVILVTTKSGKMGVPTSSLEYNGFVTFDQVANRMQVLNAEQYVANGGTDFGSQTDWFEELTRPAIGHTHNLAMSGSSQNTSYRVSLNYRDNQGVVEGVDNQRINTRLSVNHRALDGKLRLSVNAAFNNRNQNAINNEAFRYATIYNPTAPVFEPEGPSRYGGFFQRDLFDFFNPVALAQQQSFQQERKSLLTSFRADYDILDNLVIAVSYSQDRNTGMNAGYWSKFDPARGFGGGGIANRTAYNNLNELMEATLNWSFEPMDKLDATLLVGGAVQRNHNDEFGVEVRQFLFDDLGFDGLQFGAIREGANTFAFSNRLKDVLNSGFARLNLNYDNTYFFSASARYEEYSGFGPENRGGFFPAASFGVDITQLADLGPFDNLKFRASFGVTGNLPPNPLLGIARFGTGNRIDLDGDPLTRNDIFVEPRQLNDPNPTLQWETKTEYNIGFDYSVFNGRITGSMDYYTRNIDNLLFGVSLPAGAPNPFSADAPNNVAGFAWANIGELQNAGFEFLANVNGLQFGQINWTPSLNFTIYQRTQLKTLQVGDLGFSEIRLSTPGSPGQNNNQIIRNREGENIGNMYGPELAGIDENGLYVFRGADGTLSGDPGSPEDWGVIGNGLPTWEFGFNNTFQYKNWDLNFFIRGTFGHDLYNSYRGFYENRDPASNTWNSVVTSLTNPNIVSTPTFSDFYVEDASFVRFDNASIGYNFNVLNSKVFSRVRAYGAVQNLWTITNYTGVDPEVRYTDTVLEDGFQTGLAPGLERRSTFFTVTQLTFGVNASFK